MVEAVQAYTNQKDIRILDEIYPLEEFTSSPEAMKAYQEIHRENPCRELYVLPSSRKNPDIIKKMGRCKGIVKNLFN